MEHSEAMVAFYHRLGFETSDNGNAVSVLFGRHRINFHRPAYWQDPAFVRRPPCAVPPCGDLCFVWEGSPRALRAMLGRAGVQIEAGPLPRMGGRRRTGSSIYVRDPDGNLLEFIIYR
jgi:catechol 2,3-dioxygenase-like lactoylglutathione lyase family enzyme